MTQEIKNEGDRLRFAPYPDLLQLPLAALLPRLWCGLRPEDRHSRGPKARRKKNMSRYHEANRDTFPLLKKACFGSYHVWKFRGLVQERSIHAVALLHMGNELHGHKERLPK